MCAQRRKYANPALLDGHARCRQTATTMVQQIPRMDHASALPPTPVRIIK